MIIEDIDGYLLRNKAVEALIARTWEGFYCVCGRMHSKRELDFNNFSNCKCKRRFRIIYGKIMVLKRKKQRNDLKKQHHRKF